MLGKGKSWIGFLLMSVVIPVGLFTSLRFAGVGQPPSIETITLNPVSWLFNRTQVPDFGHIGKTLNTTYTDVAGQLHFVVYLGTYFSTDTLPYTFELAPDFSATSLNNNFSVVSVLFTFGEDINPSFVDLWTGGRITYDNLSLVGFSSGRLAYVQFAGGSSSTNVDCAFPASWIFSFATNVTYSREVTCSVTYFNGSAYKDVIQAFNMTLLGS